MKNKRVACVHTLATNATTGAAADGGGGGGNKCTTVAVATKPLNYKMHVITDELGDYRRNIGAGGGGGDEEECRLSIIDVEPKKPNIEVRNRWVGLIRVYIHPDVILIISSFIY